MGGKIGAVRCPLTWPMFSKTAQPHIFKTPKQVATAYLYISKTCPSLVSKVSRASSRCRRWLNNCVGVYQSWSCRDKVHVRGSGTDEGLRKGAHCPVVPECMVSIAENGPRPAWGKFFAAVRRPVFRIAVRRPVVNILCRDFRILIVSVSTGPLLPSP